MDRFLVVGFIHTRKRVGFRLANAVNGPALGYMKAGVMRNRVGDYGVYGPADLMPRF